MSAGDELCAATAKVVLISDDEQSRSLLCGFLAAHGYDSVVGADTEGALAAEPARCDVAIVDTSVRYGEAMRVLQQLRAAGAATVAIVVRTNGGGAAHEHAAGGDVLLGKPFDPRELLLIVRGLLDANDDVTAPATRSVVTTGPITLSPLLNSATVAARELELTDVETRILHELMVSATHAVSRQRLTRRGLLRAWSPDDRALDTHINRLRRKLGKDRHGRTPLRTVTGVGYLLLEEWEPAT